MKFRIVTGAERDQLLGPKVGKVFDADPYGEILAEADNGEVVAVEIDPDHRRSEMIRFTRVGRTLDKSLRWLPSPNPGELIFEVNGQRCPPRKRGHPHKHAERTA